MPHTRNVVSVSIKLYPTTRQSQIIIFCLAGATPWRASLSISRAVKSLLPPVESLWVYAFFRSQPSLVASWTASYLQNCCPLLEVYPRRWSYSQTTVCVSWLQPAIKKSANVCCATEEICLRAQCWAGSVEQWQSASNTARQYSGDWNRLHHGWQVAKWSAEKRIRYTIQIFSVRWKAWPAYTRSSAIADGPRDALCQLKSCQLPRNSAETTCTSPEQIEVMKLEG